MNAFESRVAEQCDDDLRGLELQGIVVSVTLQCNQTCSHCHVRSSPSRTEMMSSEVMAQVVAVASAVSPVVVDITGGAPELNADLPAFISALRSDGHRVQVRTNLTVLEDPDHAALAGFYSATGVELLASMPCYTDRNVRAVRGAGVRDSSVRALQRLNALGYGVDGGSRLDLIYNPVGTNLPEPQDALEQMFRDALAEQFGVEFTHLLTMTNMPAGRFRDRLVSSGGYDRYTRALELAFNPAVVPLLQCRRQVEVGWDGRLWDCDFNLGEGLPVAHGTPRSVWEFDADAVAHRRIAHRRHCFGCTAGSGSS